MNTTCGASNISFGLPERQGINAAFLAMAASAGMTSAISNPLHAEVRTAIMASDVLLGKDRDAAAWIKAHRNPDDAGRRKSAGGRRNREARTG